LPYSSAGPLPTHLAFFRIEKFSIVAANDKVALLGLAP